MKLHGYDLDEFTAQYLETALWSETVCLPCAEEDLVDGCMDVDDNHPLVDCEDGEPLDDYFTFMDFTEEAIGRAVKDCADFQEANDADLADEDPGRAGHDFWLNRNGHGAGF